MGARPAPLRRHHGLLHRRKQPSFCRRGHQPCFNPASIRDTRRTRTSLWRRRSTPPRGDRNMASIAPSPQGDRARRAHNEPEVEGEVLERATPVDQHKQRRMLREETRTLNLAVHLRATRPESISCTGALPPTDLTDHTGGSPTSSFLCVARMMLRRCLAGSEWPPVRALLRRRATRHAGRTRLIPMSSDGQLEEAINVRHRFIGQ